MNIIVYLSIGDKFVPIGKLYFEERGRESLSVFAYGLKFLSSPDSFAIDPIELPLEEREFRTKLDFSLFSVVRDAGPDNWGRYLLTKRFGRELNDLEYVLGVGPNRVGALAFGPDLNGPKVYGPNGFEPYIENDFDIEFCQEATDKIIANEENSDLIDYLKYGSSLGGARPKASVVYDKKKYLAKFSVSFDLRNEPMIEYAAMTLAKKCGLNVPEIFCLKVGNKDVFLIKRFDRIIVNKKEVKLPFISGLTATSLHESDYSAWSYPHLCQSINKICLNPKADKLELFKRMVFNILINNDDDHMRNHGFLYNKQNRWCLSPLYDVVPRGQKTSTFRLAMNIGDYGKESSKRNALSASNYFGLSKEEAEDIWNKLEAKVSKTWQEVFKKCGLRDSEISMFSSSIGRK